LKALREKAEEDYKNLKEKDEKELKEF